MMTWGRFLAIAVLVFTLNSADSQPAQAFMERIGKETVDGALDRLKTMQDRLVEDVFREATELQRQMFNNASNERKGTVAQIGSELDFAIQRLTEQFGSETRGTISHASAELQNNLAVILAWTGSIQQIKDSVAALEDDVAIDIQALPFVTEYFSIRRVSGVNILQGDRSTYPILVRGERFGRPDAGEEIVVTASIGDTVLTRSATPGPNEVEFLIPANLLTKYFKADEVSLLDLKISAVRERKICRALPWCRDEVNGTFKLLLTPERIGKLEIKIERPKFDWVQREVSNRNFSVKDPGSLILEPPAGVDGKKRRYGVPRVTCTNIKRDAWKLPNGRILLPEDRLLKEGWGSSSWVGSPPGPDLERFDNEAIAALGFSTGFYANNSCDRGQSCGISPDEIRRRSTKLTEVGFCDIMKPGPPDLSTDRDRVTIPVLGTAPYESSFEVHAPIEIWEHVGFDPAPVQTRDVTSTGYVDVSVPDDSIVSLVFKAFDGITREGRIPRGLPRGLKVVQYRPLRGGITVYSLQFDRGP